MQSGLRYDGKMKDLVLDSRTSELEDVRLLLGIAKGRDVIVVGIY